MDGRDVALLRTHGSAKSVGSVVARRWQKSMRFVATRRWGPMDLTPQCASTVFGCLRRHFDATLGWSRRDYDPFDLITTRRGRWSRRDFDGASTWSRRDFDSTSTWSRRDFDGTSTWSAPTAPADPGDDDCRSTDVRPSVATVLRRRDRSADNMSSTMWSSGLLGIP